MGAHRYDAGSCLYPKEILGDLVMKQSNCSLAASAWFYFKKRSKAIVLSWLQFHLCLSIYKVFGSAVPFALMLFVLLRVLMLYACTYYECLHLYNYKYSFTVSTTLEIISNFILNEWLKHFIHIRNLARWSQRLKNQIWKLNEWGVIHYI